MILVITLLRGDVSIDKIIKRGHAWVTDPVTHQHGAEVTKVRIAKFGLQIAIMP